MAYKKMIVSFYEEYMRMDVEDSFPEKEAETRFHDHVSGRIMEIFGVERKEAEKMMSHGVDEEKSFISCDKETGCASIKNSDSWEYIFLLDVPETADDWTPVYKELPKEGAKVQVTVETAFGRFVDHDYYVGGKWINREGNPLQKVTAWRPCSVPYQGWTL